MQPGDQTGRENGSHITRGPTGCVKEFRLYSECTEKPLKGFTMARNKFGGTTYWKKKNPLLIPMDPLSVISQAEPTSIVLDNGYERHLISGKCYRNIKAQFLT